ncbi:hypothetical protein [Sphingomonas sp. dw_22]|uniref:hypothetical protein n=1 Tax=Sphingomonas sp. dw_22 TaxID=2721175 RepID=UPI001BD6B652|nr:hypothetical protein [Sphingomonas sp. dw_22]
MIRDDFFRSMSLAEDLGQPERFAHYRPTRRATAILSAVLTPGAATMVIAPYGSGKSLAAGVAALAVRNEAADRDVVTRLLSAVHALDASLHATMGERLEAKRHGLVIALSGHVPDPLAMIADGLAMASPPMTVDGFGKALRAGGWDHVSIIWDEFGRHLEGIVGSGRPDELDTLQRLAERVARANGPTMSLTLLLHQNLLSYASRLNETTRSEWRKVEGRFAVVRMVEDSQEIYRLIGQVVADLRPTQPKGKITPDTVEQAREARWFDGMTDKTAIAEMLGGARPLTAGALQVLPILAARVGQHERSLFSFLREADLSSTVGIEQIYTAFADALRGDVGIGGAYRRWVETESARSRASDELQREVLAAACLLQLGASGERRRLPRDVLELAVSRPSIKRAAIAGAVDALIDAKLLLWRRHNDDVAVWHGADIDVAIRVREEREKQAYGFNLKQFLDDRFPAPSLRAPGHNARRGVNRFFEGAYVELRSIGASERPGDACRIEYVLARSASDIEAATSAAAADTEAGRILVIPSLPVDVESAAVEIMALEALRGDREFIASDPMVTTELDELQSVAFEHLATLLRSLLDPRASAATWWAEGDRLDVSGDRPGSMAASTLLDRWYRLTPRIANEQLMRDVASRTMQTARVRVVGAVLEHAERKGLGYSADDKGAEASIYRTVLERTGLHRFDGNGWGFAHLDEIGDEGLAQAWTEIALFLRDPTDARGKPLSALIYRLAGTPHGVPRAVMPLLIAAGYRAFARTVALYVDGIYLPDVLGFQFDQLIMNPDAVTVRVQAADLKTINYLRELSYAFTHEQPGAEDELIRAAHDAVAQWRAGVPEGSRRTQKLDAPAKALLRAIDAGGDPVDLLFTRIPAAFGSDKADTSIIPMIELARKSVDGLSEQYATEAMAVLTEAFRVDGSDRDLLSAVRGWAACFDHREMDQRGDLRISDKAVLRKAVETANERFSPKSFAGAMSSILLQRGLDKWDDRTALQFRAALREVRERLETAAIDTTRPRSELRPIIEARLADLANLLAQIDDLPAHSGPGIRKNGGRG